MMLLSGALLLGTLFAVFLRSKSLLSEFAPTRWACYRAWGQFVRCFFCLKRCSASQLSALC